MLPKINQVLHINQLSTNEEESRKEYKSRIADLTEFYIAMEVPLDEETGKLKRLQPGEELSVYYTSEAGVKNCFNTSVIGIKDDVIRQVLIQKPAPESITKIQRRSFLRVQSQLEIAVQYGSHIHFVSLTEDVGGGGLSFVCDGISPLWCSFSCHAGCSFPIKKTAASNISLSRARSSGSKLWKQASSWLCSVSMKFRTGTGS